MAGLHRLHQRVQRMVAALGDVHQRLGRARSPLPGVVERLDARVRPRPGRRLEQDVVAGVRIERRVEVDEVDAAVRDMLAQHLQIVPIEELNWTPGHPEHTWNDVARNTLGSSHQLSNVELSRADQKDFAEGRQGRFENTPRRPHRQDIENRRWLGTEPEGKSESKGKAKALIRQTDSL